MCFHCPGTPLLYCSLQRIELFIAPIAATRLAVIHWTEPCKDLQRQLNAPEMLSDTVIVPSCCISFSPSKASLCRSSRYLGLLASTNTFSRKGGGAGVWSSFSRFDTAGSREEELGGQPGSKRIQGPKLGAFKLKY